jgi:hypothetical protein
VYVLDQGLEPAQRDALAAQATVVPAPALRPGWLSKFVLPLERPARVMILVDADVLFTKRLTDLIAVARGGRAVAFADRAPGRFFPQWRELLDLDRLTPRTYVNTGLLALPRQGGSELLAAAEARLGHIELERSILGGGPPTYPLSYLDQDVFNAVLAARARPDDVLTLDARLAPTPPFRGLRIADAARLRCTYRDGAEPYALHHLGVKPWRRPTAPNVYTRLLTRVLLDAEAAVPVPPRAVPLRLRNGGLARPARGCAQAQAFARDALQDARLVGHRLRRGQRS